MRKIDQKEDDMTKVNSERLLVVDVWRISELVSLMTRLKAEIQMLQIGKELISGGGLIESDDDVSRHALRIARQELERLGRPLRDFIASLHKEADRLALEYLRAYEPLN